MNEIMRNNYIVFISSIVYALLVLIGCGDDNPVNDSREEESHDVETILIPLGESEGYFEKGICFTSNNEEKTLTFETNKKWNIAIPTNIEWCTVSSNNGVAGTVSLTIKVTENTFYDERNAILTLKVGEIEKRIKITQKQQDALLVSSNIFELDKSNHIIDVEVKSNIEYEVIIPPAYQSWIVQNNKSRSLSSNILSFTVQYSWEYDKREGEIIIRGNDKSETIHIYQTGEGMLLTSAKYLVSDSEEMITVRVKSNFDFKVKLPAVDWIQEASHTRGISSHTLYYTIKQNTTDKIRCASLLFYDEKSDVKREVQIIQGGKNRIEGGKAVMFLSEGGTLSNYISDDKKNEITDLTLGGYVNGDDMLFVREMSRTNVYGDEYVTNGKLTKLDLSNAFFVGGGTYYIHNHQQYTTKSNTIPIRLFHNCRTLQEIVLPDNITKIEEYAFFCCTQLSKINLHDNISEIGNASFHKCTSLKTVKLPSNLNKISKQLFISSGIKDIDIPEAVTTIETEAFLGCGLKKINIGSNLKNIGYNIFWGCSANIEVHIKTRIAPYSAASIFNSDQAKYTKLYVPKGCFNSYSTTSPWREIRNIYEE